ncbi:MAG: hypothetical protein ACYCWE_15695 [Eubacteriales bacterium]
MTLQKTTILILALILTLTFISSCANDKVKTDDTAAATETETPETEAVLGASNVLDLFESIDYGGYALNILTTNNINSSLPSRTAHDNTLTGDIVNDALFNRDLSVGQKYNITVGYTLAAYDGGDIVNMAKKSITAGDDAYDFIIGDIANVCAGLAAGFATDMGNVPNLDFEQPWWNSYINSSTKIAGHNFYAVGDISPRNMSSAYVMMFSLDLFDDYSYTYPYQTVRDGKWTLDEMTKIIKGTAQDIDGDGKMTLTDSFGMISDGSAGWCMYIGCGGTFVELDEDSLLKITCNTERSEAVVSKLGNFFAAEDVDKLADSLYGPAERFMKEQGLFLPQTAVNLSMFTDCEMDFGILPMPKLDEAQENYRTFANFWCLAGVVIPKTSGDLERTGTLIEALTALSRFTSTEAAYEITLLVKQTRDEESIEMLKLATDNLVLELGALYNWGGITQTMETCIRKNTSFLTKFASAEKQVTAGIEKLITVYTAEQE